MKTISLIQFKYNENNTGIKNSIGEDIRLLLKPCYLKVFEDILAKFKAGIYTDFVKDVWIPACDEGEKLVISNMIALGNRYNIKFLQKHIEAVQKKFRGNLGEIFAEMYFTEGKCGICDFKVYNPIDPFNEDYTDAASVHKNTHLPIHIQVKNFKDIKIDRDVFNKAEAMFAQKLYGPKSEISKEDRDKYIEHTHQIIFSMTDVIDTRILSDYSGQIMFIGPNEINEADFQGNSAKHLEPSIGIIENIIQEITLFS